LSLETRRNLNVVLSQVAVRKVIGNIEIAMSKNTFRVMEEARDDMRVS
jgi:hypothetical protein